MHKKLIGLIMAFSLLPAAAVLADEGAGCGLGKTLWEGQSGLLANISAATTNGSSGTQTFGITSGTSGCNADSTVKTEKEQEVFVAVNLENISQEMAQGNGEHLRALATLMGCSTSVYGEFAGMTQDKYEVLFPAADTSTLNLLSGLKREMSANPTLAGGCTRIS